MAVFQLRNAVVHIDRLWYWWKDGWSRNAMFKPSQMSVSRTYDASVSTKTATLCGHLGLTLGQCGLWHATA
eukprot:340375-Amphidinium_carterae.2